MSRFVVTSPICRFYVHQVDWICKHCRFMGTKCVREPAPAPAIRQGELEQIQFPLGHMSVQTTERYLGCKQRIHNAVNDRIGLEPIEVCCSE